MLKNLLFSAAFLMACATEAHAASDQDVRELATQMQQAEAGSNLQTLDIGTLVTDLATVPSTFASYDMTDFNLALTAAQNSNVPGNAPTSSDQPELSTTIIQEIDYYCPGGVAP